MPPRLPQAPSQNSTIPMVGQAPTKLTLLGRTPCHTQPRLSLHPIACGTPGNGVIRRCVCGWGCQLTVDIFDLVVLLAERRLGAGYSPAPQAQDHVGTLEQAQARSTPHEPTIAHGVHPPPQPSSPTLPSSITLSALGRYRVWLRGWDGREGGWAQNPPLEPTAMGEG